MKTLYLFLLIPAFVDSTSAAIVVDFEALPTDASGYYNGDPSAGAPQRNNYENLGTRIKFGETEILQRWTIDEVQFGNSFIPAFGSWDGWSWSNVQNATTAGFGNQYAAFPGGGANLNQSLHAGGTYAIGTSSGTYFNVPTGQTLQSVDIANSTYTALSVLNGDGFAKKFVAGDFFRVTLQGFDQLAATGNVVGSTTIDLADFTNGRSFVLSSWHQVDLTGLGAAKSVGLVFDSSDVGAFGINTPLYIAIDNLTLTAVPEPNCLCLLGLATFGFANRRRRR